MKAYRTILLFLPLALALGACPAARAQAQGKVGELSLGDAVTKVQQETDGQVLSAESRRWDRRTEYRIKVLTPEGHVRIVTVPSSGGDGFRPLPPSTRNPSVRRAGGKEKH